MLQGPVEELQVLIKELIGDDNQCFLCRSAAVGALITNIHVQGLSAEDIATQWNTITWEAFHQRLKSFIYPKAAACKGKVKPHVNLEIRVFWLIDRPEFLGLDMSQY